MAKLKANFAEVDQIIHAGDVVCEALLEELGNIAPVSVVQGNMDQTYGILKWPKTLTLEFDQIKIGIAHELQFLPYFDQERINVFIYGHTHIPSIQESPQGILLINPGSPTRPPPAGRSESRSPSE